jgi:hypothetical protein
MILLGNDVRVSGRRSRRATSAALLLVIGWVGVSHAQDDTRSRAAAAYHAGEVAAKAGRWSVAIPAFTRSYGLLAYPVTAYYISYAYVQTGSPGRAGEFAVKALSGSPSLDPAYRAQAEIIRAWAAGAAQDPYYIDAKADDPDRPKSPKSPRPDLGRPPEPDFAGPGPAGDAATAVAVREESDLSAVWLGNDGGTYYVRQLGAEIWWFGESADSGRTWTHVFRGQVAGDRIAGTWADVPRGKTRGSGILILQRDGSEGLRMVEVSGGFGGNRWARVK